MRYVIRKKASLRHGIGDVSGAHETARICRFFTEDSEDEHVSDVRICCLNCRYRRWTSDSYSCLKHMNIHET